MTSGLRKVHKITWLLIAVVGTVFLFFTISELDFSSEKTAETELTKTSSSQSAENDWIRIALKGNQVELILKKSLKSSSSVVYGITENGQEGNGLGQVSTVGIYQFDITEPIEGIVIVDKIKDVELTICKIVLRHGHDILKELIPNFIIKIFRR